MQINYFTKEVSCKKDKTKTFEKEKIVFQSVRQEHIKLIEQFSEINDNLETILREISNRG